MKILASLTSFFVVFLFVVYLGVFTGLKINSFIAGKKLVAIQATPQVSAAVSPTSTPKPSTTTLTTLAQAPQAKTQVQGVTTQPVVVASEPAPATTTVTSSPTESSAPIADTSTPPPAPVVDAPTPPPDPPAPAPSEPPPSNRCIITLSGSQYDITEYRNIHSGGDVFQCGTDMTASFLSRHPASFLSKMSQYKV